MGVLFLDLAGQAGAGCGKAGMGFQPDGSRDDLHGFPGDAEEVSALPIPIVLPREVILGKERRGKLWFPVSLKLKCMAKP